MNKFSFLSVVLILIANTCHASTRVAEQSADQGYELVDLASAASVFPEKLTQEQIQSLKASKTMEHDGRTYEVDEDFIATCPYFFQVFTGSDHAFARYITLEEGCSYADGVISAKYTFNSPYTSYNNAEFQMSFRVAKAYNLNESVLGDRDFESTSNQPLKSACFAHIGNVNEEFLRGTGSLFRLNRLMATWLLMEEQLKGEDIYGMEEDARNALGRELWESYKDENGLKPKVQHEQPEMTELTFDEYVKANDDLRSRILSHYSMSTDAIPAFTDIDVRKLHAGDYYLVR